MPFESNRGPESGLTMVELLGAMTIGLLFTLAMFQYVDWSRRAYVTQSDQANSQSVGRAILELMSLELRNAGYSPLGVAFDALPSGGATSVRLLADHDGDGVVGTATETDENVTYRFTDPDNDGLFDLERGVDLNGDGDFVDTDESVETIVTSVVAVDIDEDGTNDRFIVYDTGTAGTANRVTLTFGLRSEHGDARTGVFEVVSFQSSVTLRNVLY